MTVLTASSKTITEYIIQTTLQSGSRKLNINYVRIGL